MTKNVKKKSNNNKIFAGIFFVLFFSLLCNLVTAAGSAHTEGDYVLKTDQLRNLTNADGAGVIVGVVSSGVKGLADAQRSGDLPDSLVILKEGKKAEGTAMMEIIHDIAPGATLLYHDFGGGREEKFIEAFQNLINAGATIIVEDVFNYEVPYFEDGTIAQEISKIIDENPDLLIISSAGNTANNHYQAVFSDGGEGYHSFNGSTGIPLEIQPGGRVKLHLQWDDPYTAASNDFDLFIHDLQSDSDVAIGNKVQTGEEKPYEKIDYQNVGDKVQKAEVRIRAKEGKGQGSHLELLLETDATRVVVGKEYLTPNDSIIGWAALPNVISVAALSAENQKIQDFSSQGTVTIAYPVPDVREKPEITGVDGVSVTGAGDFPTPFTGTSAAAPHIAGLLALVKSLYPTVPNTELRDALLNSATDLGTPGWDAIYGYGLADALSLHAYLQEAGRTPEVPGTNQTPVIPDIIIPSEQLPPNEFILTEPAVLSKPGSYILGDDIIDFSETILTITGSDINIDGNGHSISGISIRFGTEAPVLQTGILIWSPENKPVSNISIRNLNVTGTYAGISAKGVQNLLIDSCGLLYNNRGIDLSNTRNIRIQKSVTIGNGYAGIHADASSTDLSIEDNQITKNLYGIVLDGSSLSMVNKNLVTDNYYDGIKLDHGVNLVQVDNNFCAGNKNGGITLLSGHKNAITNNTCQMNNPSGILLSECSENTISGNRLVRNVRGLNAYYSDNNIITYNEIVGNDATGIMLQPSGHNSISDNRIIANFAEGILITNAVGSDQINRIVNNYLENFQNVRIQEGGRPNYQWNDPMTTATNIIGGPVKGGNVWSLPDGKGYSQTCQDKNADGICDLPFTVFSGNIDGLPLKYTGESLSPAVLSELGPLPEPKTAEDFVTRGKILMGSSDYTGAIAAYEQAIALSPTNYQAWRDKALCLKELKQYDEAMQALNTILPIYKEKPELWSTAGDILLVDMQKYAESIPFFEKAISLDSEDTHSLINLAFAYDKTGNPDRALELYRQALDINPSLTDAWNKAGNILTRAGQFEDAVRMYDKGLSIDPGNAFILNNKGYSLFLAGKYPEAIESLEKAVILDPKYKSAWKNLGDVFKAMGNIAESERAYANAA
ncbi:TPR repeat [Methanospirillum hungatei JF-1]|uniref:TPR repeat n=1 Tax=Methanospirillum hungatei JF-1 (strain ATCC 27890 / DSM 864 / NBRC 100397 / JF-1) TaxID=323259 RepID=Q2FQK2_METHJ|nr:TPR repeat [Methanospirillum hungatei JF-1]